MKIIILGAGQVGTTVAQHLAIEANDITVVDQEESLLEELQDKLDIRTVHGYAAHPDVLKQAGADDAQMIIAVTNSDEINMIACQVAWTLFHIPTKIARVRAPEFHKHPELLNQGALPIDVLISPEQLVTEYIERLIQYPGTLQVLDFAGGLVQLVGVRAYRGGLLVGHELRELNEHLHRGEARVAAIYRGGKAIHPKGDTIIKPGDEVFFIAAADNIPAVMAELKKAEKPYRRLMFAGGGNIGRRLAANLEKNYRVRIIERNAQCAQRAAEELHHTIVLHGNGADEDLLLEENIEDMDLFCAVTNDDEANILSAMLAKRLGARNVMALINRAAYVDLMESGNIDIAISPQQATIGTLLTHVRRGDVVMVHALRHGAAEAIEAVAHGDSKSSKVVGRTIEELNLPKGASVGAIVRGETVIIAHHDTMIESEDHVILFLVDKKKITDVEKLFQVGIHFI